jgi:hypothetical protein
MASSSSARARADSVQVKHKEGRTPVALFEIPRSARLDFSFGDRRSAAPWAVGPFLDARGIPGNRRLRS